MKELKPKVEKVVKSYQRFVVLNWKNGQMRLAKREPKPAGSELVFDVTFNVEIPDIRPTALQYDIKVPETKVKDVMLDDL